MKLARPEETLKEALELFQRKNKEYTKGHPTNFYNGFVVSRDIINLGSREKVTLPQTLWKLASKHLANVAAFMRKPRQKQEDFESLHLSALDLVVYFAILDSMAKNLMKYEESEIDD